MEGQPYIFGGLQRYPHRLVHVGRGKYVKGPVPNVIEGDVGKIVDSFVGNRYMAKRRRTTTKTKKKRSSRKQYALKRTVQPYSIIRNMKSVVAFSLDPAGGGALAIIADPRLKLNSAFDPTGSLGAGQPLGYDQYTALYKRVCVVKWSAKLEFCTVDNTTPISLGFTPVVSNTALTNYNHYKELPGCVSTIVTPDIDKITMFARGGVKRYFMPKSGRMLSDDTVTHAVGADPTNILYGHIWAQPMDQSSDAGVVRGILTLWQTVMFFQPEVPARS